MTDKKQLALAFSISAAAFKEGFDKAGEPYFKHCLAVYEGVKHYSVATQIAALLHDVVEDTNWTIPNLKTMGFSENILIAVNLLTKDPESGKSYHQYIHELAENALSRRVKIADIIHNSDITRLKGTTEKDYKRLEKYHKALMYLKQRERECLLGQ